MISTENIELDGSITYTPHELELNANANDLDVTATMVYITPTDNVNITGLSYDPEADGKMLWIRNRSDTYSITLKMDSELSLEGHRIYNDTGADLVIAPLKRTILLYDNGWWAV